MDFSQNDKFYENMLKKLNSFNDLNVVVIGDIILDKYLFGEVNRISPEAPVPIIRIVEETYRLGGAANVASNIVSLFGSAFLFGTIGNDHYNDILYKLFEEQGIFTEGVVKDEGRCNTLKIRVIGKNQQLLRLDYEDQVSVADNINERVIEVLKNIRKIDVIIVSDYAKGMINKPLMEELKTLADKNKTKIIVDPKVINKGLYKDVFLITPNTSEAEQLTNIKIIDDDSLVHSGKKLVQELNCNVIITRGEKGMSVFSKDYSVSHIRASTQEVYDVSGAGDTVIATLSMALSSEMNLDDAAFLANLAGGIKVGKFGTAPVLLDELKERLEKVENYADIPILD